MRHSLITTVAAACILALAGCATAPAVYQQDVNNVTQNVAVTIGAAGTIVGDIANMVLSLGTPITSIFSAITAIKL